MPKNEIDIAASYSLLNPGCVVLVSAGDKERDGVFSVTWNMPVRKGPPMAAILSGKRHFTYPLIASTGELALNVPQASLADAVLGCGTVSGHSGVDKFERFGLTREKAAVIGAPLVEETFANLECRVCQVVDMGASALLIAQIVAARVDAAHLDGDRLTFDNGLELLHHMGGNRFCVSKEVIVARAGGEK